MKNKENNPISYYTLYSVDWPTRYLYDNRYHAIRKPSDNIAIKSSLYPTHSVRADDFRGREYTILTSILDIIR